MATWVITFVCNLLIPIIMLGFGIMVKKKPPKDINYIFGYRTTRSMKNQDTWKFAHEYCGNLWRIIGAVLFVAIVAVYIPLYNCNENIISTVTSWVMFIQVAVLIVSIIPTELALKRNFNDDGTRK